MTTIKSEQLNSRRSKRSNTFIVDLDSSTYAQRFFVLDSNLKSANDSVTGE